MEKVITLSWSSLVASVQKCGKTLKSLELKKYYNKTIRLCKPIHVKENERVGE